jgi:fumarate reductase flavoprotein subunit
VGGGAAGLAATIFAARRRASVLLVDHADQLGGSLIVSTGQLSAAGTRLQRLLGIEDEPQRHFEDVMRISRGTANPALVRLAVEHAAETFDWLMAEGFQPLPDHPVHGLGHEPYRTRRYYWGAEGGLSISKVLVPLVETLNRAGAVEVRLRTEVVGLEVGDDGEIVGVRVKGRDNREQSVSAGAVLLSCGGYAANPEMFEKLNGYPQYNAAPYPWGRGAGLNLGQSVGGYARGSENVFVNFGTLFDTESYPAKAVGRVEHFPERRPPWEIYVNEEGHRFVREDVPSVDAREMALYMQPNYRYWIVFDEAILSEAPPIIIGWTRDELREAFGRPSRTFTSAATFSDLAAKAGIDAVGLARAVEGYNTALKLKMTFSDALTCRGRSRKRPSTQFECRPAPFRAPSD